MINMLLYLMKRQPGTAPPGQAAEICGPKEPLIPGVLRRKPHRPFGEFCIVEHVEKDIYGILFIYIRIYYYYDDYYYCYYYYYYFHDYYYHYYHYFHDYWGNIYIWKMNRCPAKPIIYMGTC